MAKLKAHALVCEKDVEIKKEAAKGAKIANITIIMVTGHLIEGQMVACMNEIFMLGMSNS